MITECVVYKLIAYKNFEIAVNAYLEADDNGNKVYYVTDPAPLFKLNFTK